ncbi:MAG: hypothetical protein AMS27_01435 [Bacteroides sp. SM23_62_1]|nr:MAG: hypothetical protein AMS27_01435 [Bacteroides sp. SM23_62_1]
MFRHYLFNAYRNLLRNPLYTIINIAGFAIGLSACIFIFLWVRDELSYDKYFPDAHRIYRIIYRDINWTQPRTPHPLPLTMAADFPEVETGVSISPIWGVGLTRPEHTVRYLEKRFEEEEILAADSTFFDVFPIPFIEGNPDLALKTPFGIVITRSIALKYFGNEPALGKTLEIDGEANLTITGVTRDVPYNTHFTYDFLVSYVTLKAVNMQENEGMLSDYYTWNDFGHFNYIILAAGSDPATLESKFMQWLSLYIDFTPEVIEEIEKNNAELILQPVTDIHLHSHMVWELGNNSDIIYVYAFSATALLILVIAILNFMNLSTARSERRAKETGVRKTLGAFRSQLIIQFLGESVLLTLASVFLAAILVESLIPIFSSFTGKDFSQVLSNWPLNILFLLLVIVIVGVISGSYPSFYLSSFIPAQIIKGITGTPHSQIRLRKTIVIIQFAISVFLIIATLGIEDQIRYFQNRSLGFNKSQVIVIPLRSNAIQNQFTSFRESLLQSPGISNVSSISNIPGGQFNNNSIFWKDPQQSINSSEMWVDEEFFSLLEIPIAEGRGFSVEFSTDSIASFILNETACKNLNIPDPIDEMITWEGDDPGTIRGKIIGVAKDFNYKSLHDKIAPLIIQQLTENWQRAFIIIRVSSDELPRTLQHIERTWKKFEPDLGFKYSFLEEDFVALYQSESRMGTVFRVFTLLGIIVACIGLLGLSAFAAEQRTKEIGIRKVHGASKRQVFTLLTGEVVIQVIISSLIAWPLGWLLLQKWIQDYAYHTNIKLIFFIAATIAGALVAILVTAYQSLSAASKNPIDALRYE